MKRTFAIILISFLACSFSLPANDYNKIQAGTRQYLELRVYHLTTKKQLATMDSFLKAALLPALHEAGIGKVGVFMPVNNDTATDKRIYVLIPYKSIKQFEKIPKQLENNKNYNEAGSAYINAVYNQPPYNRYETILLHAFEDMPQVKAPLLTGKKSERIYELRSYEGSTEKIFKNKVEMFNKGGEVGLFERLNFNAIFYGEVLCGSEMPNLMYMTSFENKTARDEHWKTFGSDPEWKKLSAMKEYQNNVSKIEILFLTPAEYSDL